MDSEIGLGRKIAQGSNKEVFEVEGASDLVAFRFTDRVSVFDYGAIPELIPSRGDNLMRFALAMQDLLIEQDIPSAFEPLASAQMGMFVMKKAGGSKWSLLKKKETLNFIPLEVVFRWGVPRGSSLLKREPNLRMGEKFSDPRIEFFTKFEDQDRLLNSDEAEKLLPKELDLQRLEVFATRVARVLKEYFDQIGLTLWDGKIEVAMNSKHEILLVDAITPDELRLTMPGKESVPLSKELLRHWLAKTQWAYTVDQAKVGGSHGWKAEVELPPRLGIWRIDRISKLYEALADVVYQDELKAVVDWMKGEALLPKVHVTGEGGREAALRRRLGIEGISIVDDPNRADAIIVSPDSDLANGKVNEYMKMGLWTFGPTREAAKIEWSKETGRQVAEASGIRVPRYVVIEKEKEIENALAQFKGELPVVKFDGLAAGKGVVIPANEKELMAAIRKWLVQGKVLLEEKWSGFEASAFFAINSAREVEVIFLGTAQDFKRRFTGDEGPNTGGMGAYAPHPKVNADDVLTFAQWARSTAETLKKDKKPFTGVLYLGLMKDEKKGWGLIEYNARFGDPETQALLSLWNPEKKVLRHLLQLDISTELGDFHSEEIKALCLSLVRKEYPDQAPEKEFPEWKLECTEDVEPGAILFENPTKTGRVGYLVSTGKDLLSAGDSVFKKLVESPWKDLVEWRSDILK
jgi:phosphoribosylamine--glycine ligase